MAEYIERASLNIPVLPKEYRNYSTFNLDDAYDDGWNDAIDCLLKIPVADVVEVVRCKDCAKNGLFTCPMCYIESHELIFINHDPEFFCAVGERKEGNDNGA